MKYFVLQDTKPQHCFLEVKEGNQSNYLNSFDRADFVKYLFDSLSKQISFKFGKNQKISGFCRVFTTKLRFLETNFII